MYALTIFAKKKKKKGGGGVGGRTHLSILSFFLCPAQFDFSDALKYRTIY